VLAVIRWSARWRRTRLQNVSSVSLSCGMHRIELMNVMSDGFASRKNCPVRDSVQIADLASTKKTLQFSWTLSQRVMATPDLRLLHFNDVYHIEPRYSPSTLSLLSSPKLIVSPREPVGGAARFVTVVNEYRDPVKYAGQVNLVNFFSGDAFNPSIESSVTKVFFLCSRLRVGSTYGSYSTRRSESGCGMLWKSWFARFLLRLTCSRLRLWCWRVATFG